jgi:hypothetical protein
MIVKKSGCRNLDTPAFFRKKLQLGPPGAGGAGAERPRPRPHMAAAAPMMSHAKARSTYSLKLPTLHSPRGGHGRTPRTSGRTPRSSRPVTPRSLAKAGIAPEPGKGPAESLDFNAWAPSDELADVRWQNERERKWRERQAAEREEALRARVRERRQVAGEVKQRRERQKRELEEASDAMRREAQRELGFKRKLEEVEAKEKQDQLEWKKALIEDERRMEEGYRERQKREREEKETALKSEMEKADDIVNVVLQRQAVRDGKSLMDMQREASKDEMDEVRRELEEDRLAKQHEKWERQEQAAERKREANVRVMEIVHLNAIKKKHVEETIADLKAEGERVSAVQQHGADEQAAKDADARQWRKQVLLGLEPSQPKPPTSGRPKSGDLRKRFLSMNSTEKELVGPGHSPRVKPVACTEDTRRERVQAAHEALAASKARLLEEQAAQKAEERQGEEARQQEESMRWAELEQLREQAAAVGASRTDERAKHKQAERAAEKARAKKKAADIAKAVESHQKQVTRFQNKTEMVAWKKEVTARKIAEAQERERKLQAEERTRKMAETEAHIAVLTAERKAANDAAYQLWMEQQAAEAVADAQREKEAADSRAHGQVRRLMEERRREEERARQAQAALDRAHAVVQAYAEQEARAREKIAKLLASRQGKKTEAENRKKAVLAEQARKRDEAEVAFHEAEEAARQRRAAAAAQAMLDQQEAKKSSLRKLEQQRAENARAVSTAHCTAPLCSEYSTVGE